MAQANSGSGRDARGSVLDAELERIADAHPAQIDLGLERLHRVASRAGLDTVDVPLVIVAGTNGKGSTVAMLAALWQAAGHRVGTSTSPHLVRVNERIRIDGVELDDATILSALAAIEPHIGEDTLTYFEVLTLASVHCFVTARCNAIVLEVGLGGRLDAANVWDADCAVLTCVALDHADWLGTDIDVIATEKAAVGRRGRPLIVGEPDPPPSLAPFAAANGIELVAADESVVPASLGLLGAHQRRNAACAMAVVERLAERLPVDRSVIASALGSVHVEGRLERHRHQGIDVVLDVAHNPHAARALAHALIETPALAPPVSSTGASTPRNGRRWHLVFAALGDKDIEGIARALTPIAASFACAPLDGARALPVEELVRRVAAGQASTDVTACPVTAHDSLDAASRAAFARAGTDDGAVLVAGSFLTVGGWLAMHAAERR